MMIACCRAAVLTAVLATAAACSMAGPPVGPPPSEVPIGHPLQGVIWDSRAQAEITPETLVARLSEVDIAILGEIHDNPVHHERQAWLVGRLQPRGLAFEMVPEASERGIAVFRAQGGEAGEIGPAIGWDALGWPDWSLYAPIFEAAGDAVITGGGVERVQIIRAIREGAAAAYGPGAVDAGLEKALPAADQAVLEAEMIAAHCDLLPASAAPGMVEAQRLRDARFALAALRAQDGGGGRAVLITGNQHARTDRGAPAYLARLEPELSVLSLGQIEVIGGQNEVGRYDPASGGGPYDFIWFSGGVPGRGDPCDAFR
ncbi:MAG: ChaN family lipoprotein [Pseudomonadota bacterium]